MIGTWIEGQCWFVSDRGELIASVMLEVLIRPYGYARIPEIVVKIPDDMRETFVLKYYVLSFDGDLFILYLGDRDVEAGDRLDTVGLSSAVEGEKARRYDLGRGVNEPEE